MYRERSLEYVKITLISAAAIALQLYFVPTIEIRGWRPDFILLVILFFGYKYGPVPGTIIGFVLGLFQDSVSVTPMGLSSLANCIVGFVAGQIKQVKLADNILLLVILLILLAHGLIFYAVYQYSSEVTYFYLVFTRIFPNTVYSLLIGLILFFLFGKAIKTE